MCWGLNRLGFSEDVIKRICSSCRQSTLKQYQSAWKGFLGFLKVQKIPHGEVSIPVICVPKLLLYYSREDIELLQRISVL